MDKIPVTFEHKGETYHGYFEPVSGSGHDFGRLFHLTVNRRHWGQLWLTDNFGWKFASNTEPELAEQIAYFERVILAWYQ